MSVSIRQKVKACFTLDKAPNPQVNVRRNGQVILEAHQALTFMQRLRGLHALPLSLKTGQKLSMDGEPAT